MEAASVAIVNVAIANVVAEATVNAAREAKAIAAREETESEEFVMKVVDPMRARDVAQEMAMVNEAHVVTVTVAHAAPGQVSADHHAMVTCKVVAVPAVLHKWGRYCHRSCKNT
ncbi:MAG: hypothetical protein Rhob2KO_15900 [Rhodopirellula baltica]